MKGTVESRSVKTNTERQKTYRLRHREKCCEKLRQRMKCIREKRKCERLLSPALMAAYREYEREKKEISCQIEDCGQS
jgi:hypothetical protein